VSVSYEMATDRPARVTDIRLTIQVPAVQQGNAGVRVWEVPDTGPTKARTRARTNGNNRSPASTPARSP
jgi:hypothetical protein